MPDPILQDFGKRRPEKNRRRLDKIGGPLPVAALMIVLTVLAEHFGDFLWDEMSSPYAEIKKNTVMMTTIMAKQDQTAAWEQQCDATIQKFDNRLSVVESKQNSMDGKLAILIGSLQSRINRSMGRARKDGYIQGLAQGRYQYPRAEFKSLMSVMPQQATAWMIKPGD